MRFTEDDCEALKNLTVIITNEHDPESQEIEIRLLKQLIKLKIFQPM